MNTQNDVNKKLLDALKEAEGWLYKLLSSHYERMTQAEASKLTDFRILIAEAEGPENLRISVRTAIAAQVRRWDAERAIEKSFGDDIELETETVIKEAAALVNNSNHIPDSLVEEAAEKIVQLASEAKGEAREHARNLDRPDK